MTKTETRFLLQKWFPELAADFLWRGSVTGTSSHELYGLAVTVNFVGSAMSGDIRRRSLTPSVKPLKGKEAGRSSQAGVVRLGWLTLGSPVPEALPNILGVVVESNYLRKLWGSTGS